MNESYKNTLQSLIAESALYPQEQMLKVKTAKSSFRLGIPLETNWQENRVALTPDAVSMLVANGYEIIVEVNAGKGAKFSDNEYSEAGAQMVYDAKDLYQKCKVILKVGPPTAAEIEMMQPETFVISAMNLAQITADYIHLLNAKHITAAAYELLEDEEGGLPVMRAMSEISGSTVMLIAAEYLSSTANGKGIIMGGITGVPPTKVVILGAGTVGEFAARAALGLGAEVRIFDNHLYKLRRIRQELGQNIYTAMIDKKHLTDSLKRADIVIGAIRAEEGRTPCVVTEEMVSQMQPNSIIVDVSIDHGGCVETSAVTTHQNPTFKKHGVIHYCVPNIASRVARTATFALSNIFSPLLLKSTDLGGLEELIFTKDWFMKSIYTYRGYLTNAYLGERFGMNHRELSLLRLTKY